MISIGYSLFGPEPASYCAGTALCGPGDDDGTAAAEQCTVLYSHRAAVDQVFIGTLRRVDADRSGKAFQ